MTVVLAHVSDLHASTFGDTFHDRKHLVRRSARPADVSASKYEVRWEEAGWRVLHEKNSRRGKLAIVDPEGYLHAVPSARELPGVPDVVERAAAKACRLEARRASTLAHDAPTDGALATMLEHTPENANLRLFRAARAVEASDADYVVITGDITDDGDGYELVARAFAKHVAAKRLLAVPGNHDLYLFPMAGSLRPRPTAEWKQRRWVEFAESLGLSLDPSGAWMRELPEANAVVVGLNSCARPQRRFFRHNGSVGQEQLAFLRRVAGGEGFRKARHRIVALHHHVVPLPHGVGRKPPSEIGMRLDDALAAAEVFDEVGVTMVLHGHRHVSEQRQPAGSNFTILASPSLTLGCRSGDGPSYWRIELGEHAHAKRVHVPIEAMDQEEDPDDAGETTEEE